MSDIISIGKSALAAAQIGISTTGHNIANAATPGYSRQVVVQAAAQAQSSGSGFIGQGTEVASVSRVYSEILNKQVVNSQALSSSSAVYSSQLGTLDNMLSDASAGINPAMTNFFNSVSDLAANPSDTPTRQTLLSNAQSLVNRLQSTNSRLNEVRNDINTQISGGVSLVNTYARQISALNNSIETALSNDGNPPNDLMDQRDQLVSELSKQIKTTVVTQGQGGYNIYVGNGLPLVIGKDVMSLTTANSPTDPGQLEVAYQASGKSTILGATSLPGGTIGGLLQFRAESLDPIQNQIGQVALVLGDSFNTQLQQGIDLNGNTGSNLFNIPTPVVSSNVNNNSSTNAVVNAQVVDARAVTSSDYRLQYDTSLANPYKITRLSDGTVQTFSSLPQTVDGLSVGVTSGSFTNGDDFVIRPTRNTATTMSVAITDAKKLAFGNPVLSSLAASTNTGSGTISTITGKANSASPVASPLVMTSAGGGSFTFLPTRSVTVTTSAGASTTYAAGSAATIPSGATVNVAGLSFSITGTPANGDQFTFTSSAPSVLAPSDNRNGLLLAALQNQGTLSNSTISYSTAFAQIVNGVGNKTRELNITAASEASVLTQATAALQSESGVNLDEEATNLLRYQQAYQAAGKMMQIASQLFDTLMQIRG